MLLDISEFIMFSGCKCFTKKFSPLKNNPGYRSKLESVPSELKFDIKLNLCQIIFSAFLMSESIYVMSSLFFHIFMFIFTIAFLSILVVEKLMPCVYI